MNAPPETSVVNGLDFSHNEVRMTLAQGVSLTLYRVKRPGEKIDRRQRLHRKVRQARQSYSVWGNVPLFDQDDDRSFIYLVRAKDPENNHEEWLSMRVITANGEYGDDIEHLAYYPNDNQPIPLSIVLKNKGIQANHLVAISRICKISAKSRRKNRYFAPCFTAMRLMALHDVKNHPHEIKYVVMRYQAYLSKLASVDEHRATFHPATATLGVKPNSVRLYREFYRAWDYALQFPGYFLDPASLRQTLTEELGPDYTVNGLRVSDLNYRNAKFFRPLLTNHPKLKQKIFSVSKVKDGMILALMDLAAFAAESRKLGRIIL